MPYDNNIMDNSAVGVSSIFRSLGGVGNVSGPAIFMIRTMMIGSTTGALVGMGTAMIAALAFGTAAVPFMVGATLGFGGGVLGYYRACMAQALCAYEDYPSLLLLHLASNYPTYRWDRNARHKSVRLNRGDLFTGWVERSMLLVAWQSAWPAIDEIHTENQNLLVKDYIQQASIATNTATS